MDRRLLRPRWIVAHLVVLVLGALFIVLGVWQMGRLEERRELNDAAANRFEEDPIPLNTLLLDVGNNVSEAEYRRVTVVHRL